MWSNRSGAGQRGALEARVGGIVPTIMVNDTGGNHNSGAPDPVRSPFSFAPPPPRACRTTIAFRGAITLNSDAVRKPAAPGCATREMLHRRALSTSSSTSSISSLSDTTTDDECSLLSLATFNANKEENGPCGGEEGGGGASVSVSERNLSAAMSTITRPTSAALLPSGAAAAAEAAERPSIDEAAVAAAMVPSRHRARGGRTIVAILEVAPPPLPPLFSDLRDVGEATENGGARRDSSGHLHRRRRRRDRSTADADGDDNLRGSHHDNYHDHHPCCERGGGSATDVMTAGGRQRRRQAGRRAGRMARTSVDVPDFSLSLLGNTNTFSTSTSTPDGELEERR